MARILFPNGNLTLEFLPMEVDGGGEHRAPWMNKNNYCYNPTTRQCWICITSLSTMFFICLYIILLIPAWTASSSFIYFTLKYLGNLPKFKGTFVRRLRRLQLSPGQGGKVVNWGKKALFGGHRGERT